MNMLFNQNWVGLFATMPKYLEQARFWREEGMIVGLTGMKMSVFNTAIVEDERALTVERLRYLERRFSEAQVPFSIQVCSETLPPSIDRFLFAQGYGELFSDPLMFCNGPLAPFPANPAIRVLPVQDQQDRALYGQIVMEGFELLTSSQDFIDLMLRMDECYHVIGWLNDAPVGAGTVIYCGGVAGVYNVATVPSARRRGVARAIMEALHHHAIVSGYPGTALAASSMGVLLYNQLGYSLDGYQVAYVPGGFAP